MLEYQLILDVLAISLFPWFYIILPTAAFMLMLILYTRRQRTYVKSGTGKMASYRRKLELLYALVDSMPDWIYIKDRESRFILSNKHMSNYHGISNPEEMTGKTDFDYYPEDIAAGFREDEVRIMESGKSIVNKEEKIQDPEGNEAILSTTKLPVRDKARNIIGIIGIRRNITRQKKDQMRLKELSMVASGTENVVVIMDADGNFEWVNRGFESRYGSTIEEFVKKKGRNLRETSSKEGIEEILDEVKKTGKPQTYISRMQVADSEDAWSQTNITPILNDEGEIISMFLIDSDITALKKADLQIKQQKYQL